MSLTSSLRVALSTLRDHPLRTVLATTGIIIGSASLGGVLAIGDGMQAAIVSRVAQEGYTLVRITPRVADDVNGVRVDRAQWLAFDETDRGALARELGSSARVELAVQGTTTVLTNGTSAASFGAYVLGLASPAPDTAMLDVIAGRRPTASELLGNAPIVVVSDTLARLIAGDPARAVGRTIRIGASQLATVIGVLRAEPPNMPRILVPFALARGVIVDRDVITGMRLHAPDVTRVDSLRNSVQQWIPRARPAWRDSVDIEAPGRARLAEIGNAMLAFKLGLGAFAGITLLVGGIGIANVLISSVHERTREIGIRRAVGARRRDLLTQFLLESVTITGVGSMAGMALGVLTAMGATAFIRSRTGMPIHAVLTPMTVLAGVAVAIVVGLAAGIAPALRAAGLPPIEAIRQD
jgi:putative ABC transport system permease protein